MAQVTQRDAHLTVAAIRVLSHQNGQPPRPMEIADLLAEPEAVTRLRIAALVECDIVTQVESAFEDHVEVRDHLAIEDLEVDDTRSELSSDLADFDRRKQEEAEKMAQLFADGDHEKKRKEKVDAMDEQLQDFRSRKPPNPFGDD